MLKTRGRPMRICDRRSINVRLARTPGARCFPAAGQRLSRGDVDFHTSRAANATRFGVSRLHLVHGRLDVPHLCDVLAAPFSQPATTKRRSAANCSVTAPGGTISPVRRSTRR